MSDVTYDTLYLLSTMTDILFKCSVVLLAFIYVFWKDN